MGAAFECLMSVWLQKREMCTSIYIMHQQMGKVLKRLKRHSGCPAGTGAD